MFDAFWWCRSILVTGLGGRRGGPMKQCLVYCRDFLFLSMWSSVSGRVMDQKKNTRNSPWSDV